MKGFIIFGAFCAVAAFGYFVVAKLERFWQGVQTESARPEESGCFMIAVSEGCDIAQVLHAWDLVHCGNPLARCAVITGSERQILADLECGGVDAAVLPAAAQTGALPSRLIRFVPQDFPLGEHAVTIGSSGREPQLRKFVWNTGRSRNLAEAFLDGFGTQQR